MLMLTRAGRHSRQMGLQYVGRLKELQRLHRRHSAFWIGMQWTTLGGSNGAVG